MEARILTEPKARSDFVRAVVRELTLAFLPNGSGWKRIVLKVYPAGKAITVDLTTTNVHIHAEIYQDGHHWDIWGAASKGKSGALRVSFDVPELERGLHKDHSKILILYQLLLNSPEAAQSKISEDAAVAEFSGKGG